MRLVGRALGRLLGALVSIGLVAAVVVGAGWVAPPSAPTAAAAVSVPVPAPPTDLVCPGPARLPTEPEAGGDVVYDPQFDPAPVGSVSTLAALTVARPGATAAPARVTDLAGTQELAQVVPSAGAGVAALGSVGAGTVLHADADEGGTAWLAGSVVVSTAAGDLRGLVGATCRPAGNELWLVGGSTSLGSSARLVLQNPGQTAAEVDLGVWGPTGPVELAGSSTYLVPPSSERVVLLEGAAAEQPRLVVHVVATGGLVGAYLQDSALNGLVPVGVDDVVPGSAPATRQVVPGVAVEDGEEGQDLGSVRLLAPTDAAIVQVWALGAAGQTQVAEDLALTPGQVVDVPLAGLPAGTWTVVVDADVPVVAGAEVTRGAGSDPTTSETPVERAWAASVAPGTLGPLALPPDVSWRLSLALADTDGGPASAQVDVVDSEGAVTTTDVEVQPGTSRTLRLADLELPATTEVAGVVVRSTDDRFVWGVVLESRVEDGVLITVLTPVAPQVPADVVAVRLD